MTSAEQSDPGAPAGENCESSISAASILPPGLRLIPKLLALTREPDTASEEIVNVVRLDPALTTAVLRVCNSAAFGGRMKIDTVAAAVNRVGICEIYRIALQVVASPAFSKVQEIGFPLSNLWDHSLFTALAAQLLSSRCHLDPEIAFTAGLLHDLGKLALWQEFENEYLEILNDGKHPSRSVIELERERLRIDHPAVGGRLLSEWNFPEEIVLAIAFHHDEQRCANMGGLAAAVFAANRIAHFVNQREPDATTLLPHPIAAILQLDTRELKECVVEVSQRFAREQSLVSRAAHP